MPVAASLMPATAGVFGIASIRAVCFAFILRTITLKTTIITMAVTTAATTPKIKPLCSVSSLPERALLVAEKGGVGAAETTMDVDWTTVGVLMTSTLAAARKLLAA